MLKIDHNEKAGQFMSVEGAILGYRVVDGLHHFDHTFVPPELRGGGAAAALARHALDHAREAGWKIVPACSYIERFIERNPEYANLL
jgi:hypothetical protein